MYFNSLTLNILRNRFITTILLLLVILALAIAAINKSTKVFSASPSPASSSASSAKSSPAATPSITDTNKNGIDDLEEDVVKKTGKYGIVFPIAELGNCANYSSCRTFCQDPVNENSCVAYAKTKGFYNGDGLKADVEQKFLDSAKKILGCSTPQACSTVCDKPENHDKCNQLAKQIGVPGGYVDEPDKLIDKVKGVLGCNDAASCKSFCEKEENRQKCSDVAQKVGLRGGEVRVGPGGCTSETTCKTFCLDPKSYKECSAFGGGPGEFRGPGGCNSPEACMNYCKNNPQSCKSIVGGAVEFRPVGNFSSPEEFARHCRENSDKCMSPQAGSAEQKYMELCRDNPEQCRPKTENYNYYVQCPPDYYIGPGGVCTPISKSADAYKCAGQAGKYWDGSSCRDYQPDKYYSDPAAACTRGGCAWSGSGCQCAAYSYDPGKMCAQSGCSWNNNSCQCTSSGVYYGGNVQSRDQQEATCKAGNGTCDWGSGICSCRNYRNPNYTQIEVKTGVPAADQNRACNASGGYCSWDSSGNTCNCMKGVLGNYSNGSSGGMSSRDQQEAGCKAGGGTCDWSNGSCYCKGYTSPPSTNTYNNYDPGQGCRNTGGIWNGSYCQYANYGSSAGTSGNYSGNTMTRDSQEATCRAGGGTCDWSNGICSCRGYNSPTSGTSTTTTTPNTAQTGMSRDSQESGCRSCGGTCNWSGDLCSCQCGGSSTTQSTSQPAQTSAPTSTQQPQSTTAPQPQSSSGVQGVSTQKNLWQLIVDWFKSL